MLRSGGTDDAFPDEGDRMAEIMRKEKNMEMNNRVEFVGGPYDGHRQSVPSPEALVDTVALPVNRNIFRMLSGLPATGNARTTSIAIYELEAVDGSPRYYFLGTTSAAEPFAQA